jgi:hypothetical protein
LIGHFSHSSSSIQSEKWEYANATGEAFSESQDIFRLRSTGSFSVVLLPYRAGTAPDAQVTRNGSEVIVQAGNERTVIGDSYYAFQKGQKSILAALDAGPVSMNGISISGGEAEVALDGQLVTIALHGDPGTRVISLPSTTGATTPLQIDYQGGAAVTYSLLGGELRLMA